MSRIAILTATKIEFHAVARALPYSHQVSRHGYRAVESRADGLHVLLIQSGIGPEKALVGAQQLLAGAAWDVVISTGFAGDLCAGAIGSILIGSEVKYWPSRSPDNDFTSSGILCHPDWVKVALRVDWRGQAQLRTGPFVSVDHVLSYARDKQALEESTGAMGVDMESAAIGEVAQSNTLPFLIIRAISDGVKEDLPVDFNLFLKPSGWAAGIVHILRTPRSWKGFLDLYRHSKVASEQLTQYFEGFFSAISMRPAPPNSERGRQ